MKIAYAKSLKNVKNWKPHLTNTKKLTLAGRNYGEVG